MSLIEKARELMHRRSQPSLPEQKTPQDTSFIFPYGEKESAEFLLTNNGTTLTRKGEPLESGKGIRVFLIPTGELAQFYQSSPSQKELYTFLKSHDRGGRHLATEVDPVNIEGLDMTLIVKDIQHDTKPRWRVNDLGRVRFDPKDGFSHQVVERYIEWDGQKPINLSMVTKDAPLHIAEPLATTQTVSIQDKEDDSELDKERLMIPGTNTLEIKPLRKKAGSVPAAPFEAYISNKGGVLTAKIVRIGELYDRLMSLSQSSPEYQRIMSGRPQHLSEGQYLDLLKNHSYGVNGLSVDGEMKLFEGKDELEVEIPQVGSLEFFYDAGSISQRLALKLDIRTDGEGHVTAAFSQGIEGGNYGEKGQVVFKHQEEEIKRRGLTQEKKVIILEKTDEPKFTYPRQQVVNSGLFT